MFRKNVLCMRPDFLHRLKSQKFLENTPSFLTFDENWHQPTPTQFQMTIGNDCVSARQVKSSAPLPFPGLFHNKANFIPRLAAGSGSVSRCHDIGIGLSIPRSTTLSWELEIKNQKISREVCDTMDNKAVDLNYDKVITFSKIYKNKLKWILIQPLS